MNRKELIGQIIQSLIYDIKATEREMEIWKRTKNQRVIHWDIVMLLLKISEINEKPKILLRRVGRENIDVMWIVRIYILCAFNKKIPLVEKIFREREEELRSKLSKRDMAILTGDVSGLPVNKALFTKLAITMQLMESLLIILEVDKKINKKSKKLLEARIKKLRRCTMKVKAKFKRRKGKLNEKFSPRVRRMVRKHPNLGLLRSHLKRKNPWRKSNI